MDKVVGYPANTEFMEIDFHDSITNHGQQFSINSPRVGSKDCHLMKLGKQLLIKAKLGEAEEVKTLMANGAPFTADWVGTSPLHWAVHYNHVEVTELLLKAGISRDARNKVDRTPSHIAAQKGFTSVLRLLMAYGADVDCKDMLRMTPLHWAAEGGSLSCVQLLVNYGCDINIVNKFGKTALDIAIENNHSDIVELIKATSAEDPEKRNAKVTHFREGNKIIAVKKAKIFDCNPPAPPTQENILKTVSKKKRIGVIVTKPDPITGLQSTLELVRDSHSPDSSDEMTNNNSKKPSPINITTEFLQQQGVPIITSTDQLQESSETKQSYLITDDGKVIFNSSKTVTANIKSPKRLNTRIVTTPKLLPAPQPISKVVPCTTSKKIIKVSANDLINMAKEKKFFITKTCSTPSNSITPKINPSKPINGKLFMNETREELAAKITAKLEEAKKQADFYRKQLKSKEEEIQAFTRQLDAINRIGKPS